MHASKEIAKAMNRVLKSKTLMNELYSRCSSIQQFNDTMGIILSYYITTRDTKNTNIDNIIKSYYQLKEENIKNKKKRESIPEVLERNIITNGVVTNSSNGYNRNKIKKYGLGTDKIYDKKLSQDLKYLEEKTSKSKFINNQKNSYDEIYYTSPGPNTFHYACSYSPERLFLGPLHQNRDTALPIIIGETKRDYMMRLAELKVSKIENKKEQKEILKTYYRVIDKLCTSSPSIAFIPIKSSKFELNASNAYTTSEKQMTISQWIEEMSSKDTRFFAQNQGGADPSNMGNLVSLGVKVPPSCIDVIEVPDSFEIMQKMAIAKGLQKGDKIDFFTGNLVSKKSSLNFSNQKVLEMGALSLQNNKKKIDIQFSSNINNSKTLPKKNVRR